MMDRIVTAHAVALALGLVVAPPARAGDIFKPAQVAAAPAEPVAVACPGIYPSMLQRRVLEKAAQGPDALRQWLFITRSLFGLDPQETFDWLDRARDPACAQPARA